MRCTCPCHKEKDNRPEAILDRAIERFCKPEEPKLEQVLDNGVAKYGCCWESERMGVSCPTHGSRETNPELCRVCKVRPVCWKDYPCCQCQQSEPKEPEKSDTQKFEEKIWEDIDDLCNYYTKAEIDNLHKPLWNTRKLFEEWRVKQEAEEREFRKDLLGLLGSPKTSEKKLSEKLEALRKKFLA